MGISRSTLAQIRFGTGFRPDSPETIGPQHLLDQLRAADPVNPSRPDIHDRLSLLIGYSEAKKRANDGSGTEAAAKAARQKLRQMGTEDFKLALERPLVSPHGFRERLATFWADHFTVSAKNLRLSAVVAAFRNEAIRPNITGSFGDLLVAVTQHPAMLAYLDQNTSFGPNSVIGKRRGRGLNENLAREILELHTLGVGSAYTQTDVREFAELLTGLFVDKNGFRFNARMAEPGAETVLGTSYGGRRGALSDIDAALRDIAEMPETAAHIARKLAVHFVADDPDADLVEHVAQAYRRSGGDLLKVYEALLDHPASWSGSLQKVKQPWDFVVTSLRAVGLTGADLDALTRKDLNNGIAQPMLSMGQAPFRAPGPDGWPEDASAWITPATLAARLEWAASLSRKFAEDTDPRQFVTTALRDAASDKLRFAVGGAEVKWEGVALVLASPEFNRR